MDFDILLNCSNDDFFNIVLYSFFDNKSNQSSNRITFSLSEVTDDEAWLMFRFRKEGLLRLHNAMELPEYLYGPNRTKFTSIEGWVKGDTEELSLKVMNDPSQVRRNQSDFFDSNGVFQIENAIRFRLWTRSNPIMAQEIEVDNVMSLNSSHFSAKRLTKIFIEGLNHRADEEKLDRTSAQLRDTFLQFGDINFVIVDWGLLASDFWYFTTSGDLVAKKISQFVRFLMNYAGVNLTTVHLIGFSWGAHVAGNAGRILKGRVGRITGLDPAGPMYKFLGVGFRLDRTDAKFVDIIHSSSGEIGQANGLGFGGNNGALGMKEPLGHVDFYPNGGSEQPGCSPKSLFERPSMTCHHYRALSYFVESISSPLAFPSCDTNKKNCSGNPWEMKPGKMKCECQNFLFMGEHVQHYARGQKFLQTKDMKPFGFGPQLRVVLSSVTNSPDYIGTETDPKKRTLMGDKKSKSRRKPLMLYGTSYSAIEGVNYPNNVILIEALKSAQKMDKTRRS